MDIRYKLYPYPVLSNYSDDYINSSFDSAIEVKREGYNIVISVVSEIKNSELEVDKRRQSCICISFGMRTNRI